MLIPVTNNIFFFFFFFFLKKKKKKKKTDILNGSLGYVGIYIYIYDENMVEKDLQHQSSLQIARHRQGGGGRRRWQKLLQHSSLLVANGVQ